MDNSTSFRLASIVSSLTSNVIINGQFKRVADPYIKVEKVLHGYKIGNIVVAGADMRLILKVHYSYDSGKELMDRYMGIKDADKAKIDDFFLETCNLAAGRIKHGFGDNGNNLGISIPIKTKAFDDMFFNLRTDGEFSSEWHWDMAFEDKTLHCSVFVELLNLDMQIDPSLEQVQEVEELEFF